MAPEPDLHTTAADDSGAPRPGHDLRSARERAGMSLETMAERLRLSVAQLEALELDDYAELPPPAFVRGYLRAYARELGLEPEGFVSAYDATSVADHDPELRLTGATEAASGGRGALIGLLLILLVAAGGIGAWWYQQRMGGPADTVGAATAQTEESTAADEGTGDAGGAEASRDAGEAGTNGAGADTAGDDEVTAGTSAEAAATTGDPGAADAAVGDGAGNGGEGEATASAAADTAAANDDAATNPPEMASAEAASEAATTGAPAMSDTATADADAGDGGDGDAGASREPAAAETSSEPASEAEPGASTPDATDSPTLAATSAAGTGPDRIVLEFDGRSWLEVYDSRDRELVYTLYYGSDPVELRGWAPFEVFLGNSPAVEVRFNGETVDKSAFTRSDNTARFVVDASGARSP